MSQLILTGFTDCHHRKSMLVGLNGLMRTTGSKDVLHVAHAFSAEPTLSITLGECMCVRELPLPEAVMRDEAPDLLWVADASTDDVATLRAHFPATSILVTVSTRGARRTTALLDAGADLVLDDPSVVCAAAGLKALARRPRVWHGPGPATAIGCR